MPHEIQFDANGHLYIAERDSHAIRKVDAKTGMISTFAGTGTAGFSVMEAGVTAEPPAAQHRCRPQSEIPPHL